MLPVIFLYNGYKISASIHDQIFVFKIFFMNESKIYNAIIYFKARLRQNMTNI